MWLTFLIYNVNYIFILFKYSFSFLDMKTHNSILHLEGSDTYLEDKDKSYSSDNNSDNKNSSKKDNDERFYEWLAGIIDGDGRVFFTF